MTAIIMAPTSHFTFLKLPLELRQRIYKLVFPCEPSVIIKSPPRLQRGFTVYRLSNGEPRAPERDTSAALLRTNSVIFQEAREFFWTPQHFVAANMTSANIFLHSHASYRRFITSFTFLATANHLAAECYHMLRTAPRLRELVITMPPRDAGGLIRYLRDHWDKLEIFVLEPGLSYEESLARLKLVRFETLYDAEGDSMTPELRHSFWRCMRVLVKRHFDR